jgi:hypothetical protein
MSLPVSLQKNLLPEERQILTLKYKSHPIGSMDSDEIDLWGDALLLKIHAITGWTIPEKSTLLVLVDQFKKKMVESYSTCNPDEIEFAFRQTGTTVKDWGKSMNLSLIDEVMMPYLAKRFEVSKIEEQQKNKMLSAHGNAEMTNDELWDSTEAAVKKGNYPVSLIPNGLYEWMESNGNILINREEKFKYVERATLYRHGKLNEQFESDPSDRYVKNKLKEFNDMRTQGYFVGEEKNAIQELARKMVIFDMMKSA